MTPLYKAVSPDIKINKILCIRKDWYEELVELIKARFVKGKRNQLQKREKKEEGFRNKNRESQRAIVYEGTNIYHTRDSRFWSWRRVKEYYRELFIEENMDKKIKRVRELIYG